MKVAILFLVIVGVLVGAAYGLMVAGILPFGKKVTKSAKSAAGAGAPTATTATRTRPSEGAVADSLVPPPRPPARRTAPPAEDAGAEKRLRRMAAVYDGMPADSLKPIVDKLPDDLVRDLLKRMDDGQVGKILLVLPPDRAARLTRSLVGGSAEARPAPSR